MYLVIDKTSEAALYEQLVQQLAAAIRAGELVAGERLPSVRSLARDLGINLHTVNKAYAELRDLGYVQLAERSAPRVTDELPAPDKARLQSQAKSFVNSLLVCGYSAEQIGEAIKRELEKGKRS